MFEQLLVNVNFNFNYTFFSSLTDWLSVIGCTYRWYPVSVLWGLVDGFIFLREFIGCPVGSWMVKMLLLLMSFGFELHSILDRDKTPRKLFGYLHFLFCNTHIKRIEHTSLLVNCIFLRTTFSNKPCFEMNLSIVPSVNHSNYTAV